MQFLKLFLYVSLIGIHISYSHAEESNNHRNEETTKKSDKKEQKSIMQHVKKIISNSSNSTAQWISNNPKSAIVIGEVIAFSLGYLLANKSKDTTKTIINTSLNGVGINSIAIGIPALIIAYEFGMQNNGYFNAAPLAIFPFMFGANLTGLGVGAITLGLTGI